MEVHQTIRFEMTSSGCKIQRCRRLCVITMAPIVNEDVAKAGVKSLTKDQLISIFTGKTTNWKDVGGPDEDIVLVTRPDLQEQEQHSRNMHWTETKKLLTHPWKQMIPEFFLQM